jgi:hypothetical protein
MFEARHDGHLVLKVLDDVRGTGRVGVDLQPLDGNL